MPNRHEATRSENRFTLIQGAGIAAILVLTWLLASSVLSNWSIADASRPARSLVASLPSVGQSAAANVQGSVSSPGLSGAAGGPVAPATVSATAAQAVSPSEGSSPSVAPVPADSRAPASVSDPSTVAHSPATARTAVAQPSADAASAGPRPGRTTFRSADASAAAGTTAIVGDANTLGLNPNGYPLNPDGMPIYPNSLHAPNSASLSGLDGSTQSAQQIANNLVFPDGVPMPNVTPGTVPTSSDYYTPFIRAGLSPSAVYRPSDLSSTLNPQIMQALGFRMGTAANDPQGGPVWVGPLTPSSWYTLAGQ